MDLAIIIVSWNVRQLLQGCLTSIFQSLVHSGQEGVPPETAVWVVDNHSSDNSPDMVRERFPSVHLIANQHNPGFAAGNNQAMEAALATQPRYLFLLNPDTVVRGRALETLVQFMDSTPKAGMAGARLVYGDGSFQHSGFAFPGLAQIAIDLLPVPTRLHETQLNGRYSRARYAADAPPFLIDHPLGASMVIRREVVETVGMMDSSFHMYCEEVDWAMRIHAAGWNIYCVPQAEVVHYGGQSTTQIKVESLLNLWRSRYQLYRKHYTAGKVKAARQLVKIGMWAKSRQATSAEQKAAYRQVADIWSKK